MKKALIPLGILTVSTLFFYSSFAGMRHWEHKGKGFHRIEINEGKQFNISKEDIDTTDYYKPSLYANWYIQLDGDLRTDIPADIYDVDLFDTPKETIEELKQSGKKVICYFNAGAYEDWREDAYKFDPEDIGKPMEGWEGEYWLNIKSEKVRQIMVERMELAKSKGCDGVDPDNVNGYQQDTGFDLTYQDQLDYNIFLSREAHKLGLSIGLKNDLEQINDLVNYFDFAVNEECHQYDECDMLSPFIQNGKPVFNIEYDEKYLNDETEFLNLCQDAHRRGFKTVVMPLDLDGSFVKSCDYGEW